MEDPSSLAHKKIIERFWNTVLMWKKGQQPKEELGNLHTSIFVT